MGGGSSKGGIQGILNSATGSMSSIIGMPSQISKMMMIMVVMGGIGLLVLVVGLSWGIGSGHQDVGNIMAQGVQVGKMAAMAAA